MTYRSPPTFRDRLLRVALVFATVGTMACVGSVHGAKTKDGVVGPPVGLDELKSIEARVQHVVEVAQPAVVAVRIGKSQGSGIVVGDERYVLTAGHVAEGPGQQATITFADGKTAHAKSLGIDRRFDAALLKITDDGDWPSVEMGHSHGLLPGTWCVAMGHPLGYQEARPPVVRLGRILRPITTVIQTDCALVAGDSGGPLLDLDGKVIGIHSRIAASTSMNFHVPIDAFHDSWDRLVKGEMIELEIPTRDSEPVREAFEQLAAASAACVVRVVCDDCQVAFGTVVGPDGWILTKASELSGPVVCQLGDDRKLDAKIVGIHPKYDLAMLKIEAKELPEILWKRGKPIPVGSWVAAPGPDPGPPLAIGVVSVPKRRIPPPSGMLGVAVADGDNGALVINVLPNTAAQTAGLEANDLITHINKTPTPTQAELISAIRSHRPGEQVTIRVRRGNRTLKIKATLTKLESPAAKKRQMQNRSGVGISQRHEDFPAVIQHDTVLMPSQCGGPLIDLSGRVVGINIARGGRTETYAVPAGAVLGLMYDLMSGRLAPSPP